MERWTRPVFRTDLEFKTCYYTNDENLRHADPGWDAYFADYIANDPGIQHCFEHADDDAYYSGAPQIVSRDFTYVHHPEDHRWKPPSALAEFVELKRWVAWRGEPNPGKLPTKIPYRGIGRKASTTDAKTWLTLAEAEAVAHAIAGEFGLGGGVGIVLGGPGDGACLIGADLDSCRDPDEGDLEPWAAEVVERFGSYSEVSPSLTGVKIFALSDFLAAQAILGGQGRQFKRSGGEHPPAIEVFVGGRYFTVTGKCLGDAKQLRTIPAADFRWLIVTSPTSTQSINRCRPVATRRCSTTC